MLSFCASISEKIPSIKKAIYICSSTYGVIDSTTNQIGIMQMVAVRIFLEKRLWQGTCFVGGLFSLFSGNC